MTDNHTDIDASIEVLTGLVDELIALVTAENRELETGVPSALSRATARKALLGAELDDWVRLVRIGEVDLALAAPVLRERLAARAAVLDKAIQENMGRLRSGIDATRCRVEAIMRAIREQTIRESIYDATGRRARMAPVPSSFLA